MVTPAKVPTTPSSPKVTRNTVLGLIVGFLIGLMIAFLLERLDRRMKTVEDVEAACRLPLLAAVPHSKSFVAEPNGKVGAGHGRAEVFRLLGPTSATSMSTAR